MDYEQGFVLLKQQLAHTAPDLLTEVDLQESRLWDNLRRDQFGSTEITRAERAAILNELNRLARAHLGQSFNDLVYVPADQGDVVFKDEDGSWEELNRFISSEEGLDDYRGEFAPRNSSRAPWRNRLALAFTQDIETFGGQRVQLTANLFNVLNLLNPDWGNVYYRTFDNMAIWDFEGYTEDGRPIVEFDDGELDEIRDDRQDELFQKSDLASRWQLQLGIRYTF